MVQPLPKHRAREYETIFIAHPDTNADGIDQIAGRLRDTIGRLDGKLVKAENWGKRRLAYPVHKQEKGIYIYLRYIGYSDLVHELERNMRMLEPVIKYITVKLDEDVDPAARPVREEDISFTPQSEEEPAYADKHADSDVIGRDSMNVLDVPDDLSDSEDDMQPIEEPSEDDSEEDGNSDDEEE